MAEGTDFSQVDERYADDPDVIKAATYIELKNKLGNKVLDFILARVKETIDGNLDKIIDLDIDDPAQRIEFRKCRSEALAAREALTWLNEIIIEGELAIEKINEEEGFRP